jgi:Sec-independent protein secretion pathway component TatC
MSFLWVPMCLLYQLGIWLCQWSPREEWDMDEGAEADELVEV